MIEKKPKQLREEFAAAIKAGIPRECVMQSVGIAQSTYYQWKKRLSTYGDEWVSGEPITKAMRLANSTGEAFQKHIVETSLCNPKLGPKELARCFMDRDSLKISSSTIHNILIKHGVGNRNQRAEELYRRFQAGMSLTALQEHLVESIDPLVRWKEDKGKYPGEILTQDIIYLHHSYPLRGAISIVVDTFDGAAFACFHNGDPERYLVVLTAHEAIEDRRKDHIVRYMYTDMGDEFGRKYSEHEYVKFLRRNDIVQRFVTPRNNSWNPYVKKVWNELKKFLFDGGVPNPISYRGNLGKLNPIMRDFLEKKFGGRS